jgi:hypothetical protein
MTSQRQIAANRRNAQRSTGPRTFDGKLRSRQNAVRHGLTAETIIGVLEKPEEYKEFENCIRADYHPRSAVEHELVLRLASLLWRLRRATAIETGLLHLQGQIVRDRLEDQHSLMRTQVAPVSGSIGASRANGAVGRPSSLSSTAQPADIALCFLRLANLNNGLLERLGRYETRLACQVHRTLWLLEAVRRRVPIAGRRQGQPL